KPAPTTILSITIAPLYRSLLTRLNNFYPTVETNPPYGGCFLISTFFIANYFHNAIAVTIKVIALFQSLDKIAAKGVIMSQILVLKLIR
ncbi:MAG TPA: hypothetical protein DDW76_35570, partial [Cyanobacteria bacterium UBA11369]|nr:hypothetical protein [Cyanobacteria bacterium UBA11369]